MQDRTINSALQALRRAGGHQGKLAEILLDLRGVDWPGWTQDKPNKRGATMRAIRAALESGPKTTTQISKVILDHDPTIGQRSATNRVYQALLRLESKGVVVRDSGVWRLAP